MQLILGNALALVALVGSQVLLQLQCFAVLEVLFPRVSCDALPGLLGADQPLVHGLVVASVDTGPAHALGLQEPLLVQLLSLHQGVQARVLHGPLLGLLVLHIVNGHLECPVRNVRILRSLIQLKLVMLVVNEVVQLLDIASLRRAILLHLPCMLRFVGADLFRDFVATGPDPLHALLCLPFLTEKLLARGAVAGFVHQHALHIAVV